jgi:hypothetical protein
MSEKGQGQEQQDEAASGGQEQPGVPSSPGGAAGQPLDGGATDKGGSAPSGGGGGGGGSAMGSKPSDAADQTRDPIKDQLDLYNDIAASREAEAATLGPGETNEAGQTADDLRASAAQLRGQASALAGDSQSQMEYLRDDAEFRQAQAQRLEEEAADIESGRNTYQTPEAAAEKRASAAELRAQADASLEQVINLREAVESGTWQARSTGEGKTVASNFGFDAGDLPSKKVSKIDSFTPKASGSGDSTSPPPTRPDEPPTSLT